MQCIVNGQPREVGEDARLAALLTEAGLDPAKVVVERNGEVVQRDAYADTALAHGDRLEILQFVGGG